MRSGLFRRLTFADPLLNQLVQNLTDVVNTLSGDDDSFTAPSTVLAGTGKVPAGAATVFYRGSPGAQLTLPAAASTAVQGNARAALVALGNESAGAITLLASGADTINGAKSLTLAAGALQMLVSDGFNQWLVLAPATILGWITSLTGDVVAAGPGAAAAAIQANVVSNTKLAQMAAGTIKGNNTGATANASDLTAAQVTAMLNAFTSALKGLVPASGGGTSNYLRADGSWATPPAPAGKTLIRRTFLTGTSLSAAAGTTFATFYGKAGGGGGGGASGAVAAAAGGSEGGEFYGQTTTIPATWSFALGGAGTPGSSAGGNGGAGGNTTFSDGTTTWTANGGPGGSGSTSATGPNSVAGPAPPAVSTGSGGMLGSGEAGLGGLELNNAGSAALSGKGGGRGGGAGRSSAGAGNAAVAPGCGGGGAVSTWSGAAGGTGAAGWGVLEEWG